MALLRAPDLHDPELTDFLRDRWSTRAFDPDHEVTTEQLHVLLEAARWSPSAGNTQPWSFIVGLRGSDTFDRFFQHLSRGNKAWAGRAGALIITLRQVESTPERELPFNAYSAYDLGQSAAHITVQAAALGLVVHQFAGFDKDATRAEFSVPAAWEPMTGIAVGIEGSTDGLDEATIEKEAKPRTRRPLSELVFTGDFGGEPFSG